MFLDEISEQDDTTNEKNQFDQYSHGNEEETYLEEDSLIFES